VYRQRITCCLILLLIGCGVCRSAEPSRSLDLPAKAIFSKGPNQWNEDVLEITRGRGAIIGWYLRAEQEEEVTVTVQYACTEPLNQAYQLSFDGEDRFWNVEPTPGGKWRQAELGTFRVRPGLPVLVLLVPPSGTTYPQPVKFRKLVVEGTTPGNLSLLTNLEEPTLPDASPGFGRKLSGRHPALDSIDLRGEDSSPMRVTGMAMRNPRELLFTTWEGDLVSLDLDAVSESGRPPFRLIAQGLSEPMGLAISGQRIFVTEKNQATELIDEDGDGKFETYRCLSHDWESTLDYHEYLFGAVIRDSKLYFASSVGMARRGKDNYQAPLRGSVIEVDIDSGDTKIIAGGLRTPDGIGLGPNDSLLVTDNQGEWLPANKLIYVQQDAFYQFRSVPPWHPLDRPQATPPAVWLPQGEIAASPTQPITLPETWGPLAGHILFGDATFGGLQRAFLEESEEVVQGAVFPFSQGFQHLLHRFVLTPEGELYAGGIARGKDWDFIERVSGLTRIRYTGREVFEPLAARIHSNGLEIEFSMPLAEGSGWEPNSYFVTHWGYQATQTYGGAKVRYRQTEVASATVSSDRRKVLLELPEMIEGEVVHVRLSESLASEGGRPLWAGDLWYTVNRIPADKPGDVRSPPQKTLVADKPYFQFSPGNAGRVLYQNYCASCHSLDGSRLVGPTFLNLPGSKRKVRELETGRTHEVLADAEYLRHSIQEPNALLVEGYPESLMPPVGGILTEKQINQLVGYIEKLADPKFARVEAARTPAVQHPWTISDFPELGPRVSLETAAPAAIQRGRQAFLKAQCLQCHAVSGYGAEWGPNLAEAVKKFQGEKLLRHIIEPVLEIHPKYQTTQFLLDSGKVVVGNVIKEDADAIHVATNLMTPQDLTKIDKAEIEVQQVSKNSAMPEGLLNVLSKEEILDLLRFLEAGPAPIVPPEAPTTAE
jgi:putative heme-binding domain-containing protein